jgi:PAS domain S-box-containing protein
MEPEPLTETLLETLDVFETAGEPWTTPEVADRLELGRRTAYARLERLVEQGRLETKSVGANARVWWRSSTPDTSGDGGAEGESTDSDPWEQQFRSLVDATEEYAIFLLDADGYVRTWNPGARRIKGYDTDDIVGRHFSTFYTSDDRAAGVPAKNLQAAAETGSVEDEGWRRREDGTQFWANVTITALRDDDGELFGYAKVTRDMTDRREYERRLREEKSFIESMLDTQEDVLYAFDTDGEFLRWNDRFREVTGYTDAELETMGPLDIVADRAADEARAAIEATLETGAHGTLEAPLVTADGEEIPYEFTGGPLVDEDGTIIGFTGTGRDITERKSRERRLERQRDDLEAELEEVFQRISDGFYALDDEFRFNYVNDCARELLGLEGSVIGQHVDEIDGLTDDLEAGLRQAFDEQEPVVFEDYIEPVDTCLETTVYPSESGLSVYLVDITERKERERELHRYEVIAETASDGIVSIDDESRIQSVNPAIETLFGYDAEELLGESLTKLMPDRLVDDHEAAVTEYLRTGERSIEWNHLELPGLTADGTEIPLSLSFSEYEHDGEHHFTGIVRDITEQAERERELRDRIRQQQVVADLGQRALEDVNLDVLMGEASELVAETLDTDYCKVLDLDAAAGELHLRQGVGWDEGTVGEATVSAVEADSQAAYTLASEAPIIVENLSTESRFSGPALLTDHDVESGISTIIGPADDPWGILGVHHSAHREFTENDANFVQSVANILATAIERHNDKEELLYQREQLAALNDISALARTVTDIVIDQSTREGIETTVCEYLAASGSYEFAWIGEVDMPTQTVAVRAEAGVEGYLDDNPITVDPDDEYGDGPTGRAFRTGEIQTLQDVRNDSEYGPWRETAEKYGFRSSAAIPLTHEGTVYGVLNVYAERPAAFEDQEQSVLAHLGETIGHAIGATERKQALMSDEVVELEFRIHDVFRTDETAIELDGTVIMDNTVAVAEDEYLVFGTATPDAIDDLLRLVEIRSGWEVVSVDSEGDDSSFELRVTDPPLLSAVASGGGYIDRAVIEDGTLRMSVHLAPSGDVRRCIDIVQEAYPNAEMLRRQQISRRDDDPERFQRRIVESLTERQRNVLEVAYHAGFYKWPRDSSGGEIAESIGVADPTFHQHL